MKPGFFHLHACIFACMFLFSCALPKTGVPIDGKKIDHTCTDIDSIPASAVETAKSNLSIYYGHTSHGSQLISGMSGLDVFKGNTGLYDFDSSGSGGTLKLVETSSDAGYYPDWRDNTVTYLGAVNADGRGSAHPDVNVVMWAWCGQLSTMPASTLRSNYLEPMADLESTYPGIAFVYFTGHLDGTGIDGNLNANNDIIRQWCSDGGRWLYDFADIECHDPEGNDYLALSQDDACNYDPAGGENRTKNWATDWQTAHPGEWYECDPAHAESADVMGNRKAYAAWYLFARIAGWE